MPKGYRQGGSIQILVRTFIFIGMFQFPNFYATSASKVDRKTSSMTTSYIWKNQFWEIKTLRGKNKNKIKKHLRNDTSFPKEVRKHYVPRNQMVILCQSHNYRKAGGRSPSVAANVKGRTVTRTVAGDPEQQRGRVRQEAAQATTSHLCGERSSVCFLVCSLHNVSKVLKKNRRRKGWRKLL